jgi:transcriptional regulator with XRE-family HTH domain
MARKKKVPPIGEQLEALRQAAGLSQSELSRRSGVRRASVCDIEAGKQQPTWETVLALVEACGGSIHILRLR